MVDFDANDPLAQQIEKFDQLMLQLMRELHINNAVEFLDTDLTPGQFFVGTFLQQRETCTMSEIANALGVSLSAITGIIDRMVKHGFVKRLRDDSDRRLVLVQLTEKGSGLVIHANTHRHNDLQAILGGLNEEDRLTLLNIMQKIIDAAQLKRKINKS
jgi:MarR family transcriptional regulator, organic hydroperoxide resistance regulator